MHIVNKLNFDKLFYLFVLLCKQSQFGIIKQKNKNLLSLLDLDFVFIFFLRKKFYIFFFKLLKFFKIFFFINFNNCRNFDFSNLYTLYYVEYLFYDLRLLIFTSVYFVNNCKNIINYNKFKLRLPFFWYATLNNYSEYFRFIKYQEYIKRNNIQVNKIYYWKLIHNNNKGNKFLRFEQSLTERYRFNLMSNSYLFYNSSVSKFKYYYKDLSFKFKSLFKYQFLVLQSFYFLSNLLLNCCLKIFKIFFQVWIIRFIYNFFMRYGSKFLLRFQYRNLIHFVDFFVIIKFDYNKFILWYYYKKLYLTIYEKINIKEFFNNSILNYNWLIVINIALYKLINDGLCLGILDQSERDMISPLSRLFLSLWFLFIEWCYFDLSLLDMPYMNLNEFNIWINLIKYNLENLFYIVLSSNFLNLKNLNSIMSVNRVFKSIRYSNKYIYSIFLKNNKMVNIKKSRIIYFCFQIISLINKINCCSLFFKIFFYRQFKLLQYSEMSLNNSNIILFAKFIKYREFLELNIHEYDVDIIQII